MSQGSAFVLQKPQPISVEIETIVTNSVELTWSAVPNESNPLYMCVGEEGEKEGVLRMGGGESEHVDGNENRTT